MKAKVMGRIVDLPIDARVNGKPRSGTIPQQAMFIPGPLPGMNDYISTGSRFIYGNDKKQWHDIISQVVAAHSLGPMPSAWFRFHWREKSKRRNPDNFTAIGKKFIFDALVRAGILENDGWGQLLGWEDHWCIDVESPGVYVEMFASKPQV